MLQVLGRNRVILLAVLVFFNAAMAFGLYKILEPERVKADGLLSSARSQLEERRAEIQRLKEEYALLQSQIRYFKELENRGFFNDQNRVTARESFEKLREISGVLKAKYNIKAGELKEDTRADEAGYVILQSPINVELDSTDDVDVYSFLKLIQEYFPGKVDVVSMEIKRAAEINSELLDKMSDGEPVPVVTSKIDFQWKTMASRKALAKALGEETQPVDPAATADPNAPPAQPDTPIPVP